MTRRLISARPWADPGDLRAMTAALSRAWRSAARPLVPCTAGDLEWWTAQGGPDADWPSRIRIWERANDVVGWAWFTPPGSLDWFVAGVEVGEELTIRDEMLAWLRRVAEAHAPSAGTPAVTRLEAWAGVGWSEEAFLVERGWIPTETALTQYHQPLDEPIELPRIPDGYRVRSLRGPDEIRARVAVHRAAFHPSKLTVEKYRILVRQDHYAWDRDVVVEAPVGSLAAFAMAWADADASIGELEPVGVHPDHQRRGLGRIVTSEAVRRLRAAGIQDAIVFSLRSNGASEALYRSVGFREIARHRQYTTPPG